MFLGKHLCGTKKTDGENDFIRNTVRRERDALK